MSSNAPRWFVRTEDGCLHGYFTREVLLIDILKNKGERVEILEMLNGMKIKYVPVTAEHVRQESA